MKRIFAAAFQHESNTFSPYPATLDSYRAYELARGQEIPEHYTGAKNEVGGYIDVLRAAGAELVPSVFAKACPAGPLTEETFAYFRDMILEDYRNAGPIDGILLSLHGAMLTESSEDGEGLLLRALRALTGPDLPIVVTLDFHANITEDMVQLSSALVTSRYYPHTDFYERGVEAAELLLKILEGKLRPTAAFRRIPLIYPHMPTDEGPLARLIPLLIAEGEKKGVILASFIAGFARADISIMGSCIYALTDNDPALAKAICDSYYEDVLDHITDYRMQLTEPEEAVKRAMDCEGLAVLADASDNPGSGALGDATEILHALLRQGAKDAIVATIWDPETAEQAKEAGPGATISVRLGGKSGSLVGKPVETEAYVEFVGDGDYTVKGPMFTHVKIHMGLTAVLQFRGITAVVVSKREQPFDEEAFRSNGIEPLDHKIAVLKSAVHYRAAWKKIAKEMMTVDMPNLTSIDERKVPFRKVPRPIYPLDPPEKLRES